MTGMQNTCMSAIQHATPVTSLEFRLLLTSLWHTGAHKNCRRDVPQPLTMLKLSSAFYDGHAFSFPDARIYLLQVSLWQSEAC